MSKKRSHRLRHAAELLGFALGLGTIPFLPRAGVRGLAWLVGSLVFYCGGRARRIGRANLALVFGEGLDAAGRDRMLRASLRQACLIGLDFFWFTRFSRRRLDRWIRYDASMDAYFRPKPQLAVTGHFGNWEILGQAVSHRGFPLMSVAAPLENKRLDAWFVRQRQRTGQIIVPQKGALRKILSGLRGEAKMAVLLDQNTLPRDGGRFVDFFGSPALFGTFPLTMAVRTGCEIILGFCLPQDDGSYLVSAPYRTTPQQADQPSEAEIDRLSCELAAAFEEEIRRRPECWQWTYKRWKYQPEGRSDASLPWYSRPIKPREE